MDATSPTATRPLICEFLQCDCGQGAAAIDVAALGPGCTALPDIEDGVANLLAYGPQCEPGIEDAGAALRLDAAASLAFARSLLSAVRPRIPHHVGSYLEIGAGSGQFALGALHALNPQRALVTDPSLAQVSVCRQRLLANGIGSDRVAFAAWDGDMRLREGAFDLVAAMSGAPLADGLDGLLTRSHAVLRPGGVLLMQVGNPRFRLAVLRILAEVWTSVRRSPQWSAEDLRSMARHLRAEEALRRHPRTPQRTGSCMGLPCVDTDALAGLASDLGFERPEIAPCDDDRYGAAWQAGARMGLSPPAHDDLVLRYGRLAAATFDTMARADWGASSLVTLQRSPTSRLPRRTTRAVNSTPVDAAHALVAPRCDLAFHLDPAVDASRPTLHCRGWVLGDVDIVAVVVKQSGLQWRFVVDQWREDVQDGINAHRDYPVLRALVSGIGASLPCLAGQGQAAVFALDCAGGEVYLGAIPLSPDTAGDAVLQH